MVAANRAGLYSLRVVENGWIIDEGWDMQGLTEGRTHVFNDFDDLSTWLDEHAQPFERRGADYNGD